MFKTKRSKIVHKKTEEKGFKMLLEENKTKEKTKHIKFEKLKISNYLQRNTNTKLSKTIFQIRAGTFDIKVGENGIMMTTYVLPANYTRKIWNIL